MTIGIRSALPEDADAIVALWDEAALRYGLDTPETVRALIAHDAEALVVAELDGRIIGSLIAAWDGWRGQFYRMSVARPHRRQGIGRLLVAEGERRLRARSGRRLTAIVRGEDERAVSFWTAAGYEIAPGQLRLTKTWSEASDRADG